MDPEQTFIRVQERFSELLTPKIRAKLEYFFLFLAVALFSILVVMHANYVQQPGCSSEFSGVQMSDAQLIQIKITSGGLWLHNESVNYERDAHNTEGTGKEYEKPGNVDANGTPHLAARSWLSWITTDMRMESAFEFWKSDNDVLGSQHEVSSRNEGVKPANIDVAGKRKDVPHSRFFMSLRESLRAAILHHGKKWQGRLFMFCRLARRIIGPLGDVAGINLNFDIPKWLKVLHLDQLNFCAATRIPIALVVYGPVFFFKVAGAITLANFHISPLFIMSLSSLNSLIENKIQWLEKRSKAFEPVYLYTKQKGYFLLPEEERSRHGIRTIDISISGQDSCFGNRWQQLLINRVVGYDTILMNSLLNSPGQGYLYSYQTKELYNLTYAREQPESSARFGDYLVTKFGVLMMSLFVFFTTTMSVSFTLRETQTRMLKFTVQLQHHARHRLPTFQLIFVHVIESLVFVPIMIGILFFLFEFYDDQLLAFMVLILVWICELFALISVRTPISMKFFPRFFLLYFLVFHIYFFSYTYGFSYLALSTTAAFMQHLILYFWNRFEVSALHRFMQNQRSHFQHHPDFHITSSTILASTLHITRFNTRTSGPVNADLAASGPVHTGLQRNVAAGFSGPSNDNPGNPLDIGGQPVLRQQEDEGIPGPISSFNSLLLWILGGAPSESLNSFLSIFRDLRDQGQVYGEHPQQENGTAQSND